MLDPEAGTSLLIQVRHNLALSNELVFVGETVQLTPQNEDDKVETVSIFIRPTQDLGFDGNRLNQFQVTTVDPLIEPLLHQAYMHKVVRPFYGGSGIYENVIQDLQFGYYAFDEIVGRKQHVGRVVLELFDREARGRLVDKESEEFTTQLRAAIRTIAVYILPNDSLAKLALAYEGGLRQDTVIKDRALDVLKHGLTANQISAIASGSNPFPEIRYKP
ncbi:hypothetical protein HYU96_01500 [Candidatus Daviesbacteria bacterium]|nr:hypothetical protein [Candidatus Daviesbacteria bacterium]